jgi:hypothetical protein
VALAALIYATALGPAAEVAPPEAIARAVRLGLRATAAAALMGAFFSLLRGSSQGGKEGQR